MAKTEHQDLKMNKGLPRFVVSLAELGATGTARIPLAITGEWVKNGREFSITSDDLNDVVTNFAKRLNGEINVDYDHASEMPEVAAGGPLPSAGRIVRIDSPEAYSIDDGRLSIGETDNRKSKIGTRFILYGHYEPTERARALIRSREYRYISPAIDWGARDKQTGKRQGTTLTSVALTNRPFLEEMPEIRLSDPEYVPKIENGKAKSGSDFRFSNFDFRISEGGQDMSKKLSMAKCDDGAGIFDGSEQVGIVPHTEVKKYHDEHLAPSSEGVETASEAARAEKASAELGKIFMAERPDEDAADHLLSAGAVTLTELRRAERARRAIDAAMAAGKLLPVDRSVAFSVAFDDPKVFDEWVTKRPVIPRLGPPLGLGGSQLEGANARVQLAELVRMKQDELRREKPATSHRQLFQEATELVRKENPELFRRYREEK